MIYPDRTVKPHTEEMGKVYQNIKFEDFDPQTCTVKIRNEFFFTNLNKYDFYYVVSEHGKEIYRGTMRGIQGEPRKTITSGFLQGIPSKKAALGDVQIAFYAAIRNAEPFLPKGHIVAREQMQVSDYQKPAADKLIAATPTETDTLIGVPLGPLLVPFFLNLLKIIFFCHFMDIFVFFFGYKDNEFQVIGCL